MSWYKFAKDFSDRNVMNHKIHYLLGLKDDLKRLSKLVFQSGSSTKQVTTQHIYDKRISSYPNLKDSIVKADKIIYDSPWKFAKICDETNLTIEIIIAQLERDRQKISNTGEKNKKGWLV